MGISLTDSFPSLFLLACLPFEYLLFLSFGIVPVGYSRGEQKRPSCQVRFSYSCRAGRGCRERARASEIRNEAVDVYVENRADLCH